MLQTHLISFSLLIPTILLLFHYAMQQSQVQKGAHAKRTQHGAPRWLVHQSAHVLQKIEDKDYIYFFKVLF